MTQHLFAVVLGFLLTSTMGGSAGAREPGALVVELAVADGVPPPPCADLAFRGDALLLERGLIGRIARGGDKHLVLTPGLARVADADRVLLLRTPTACTLFFTRGTLPAPDRLARLIPGAFPVTAWSLTRNGRLTLRTDAGAPLALAPGAGRCLVPGAAHERCRLRLHYYGYRPFYRRLPAPAVRSVVAGAAVSGHFAGPGDVARYRVRLPGPGMLVVEYRGDTGPGSLDMAIRDAAGHLLGTGGASVTGAGAVDVAFTYRGSGPADFDAGFLFNPNAPLICMLTLRAGPGHMVEARLRVENRGDRALTVAALDSGTVRWFVGRRLVAAAHPGRPPIRRLLAPGAGMDYAIRLALPAGARTLAAKVDTGAAGPLSCAPTPIRRRP